MYLGFNLCWGGPSTGPSPLFYCSGVSVSVWAAAGRLLWWGGGVRCFVGVNLSSSSLYLLVFTRDSLSLWPVCRNQYYDLQTPLLFRHSTSPLHRLQCCAVQCFPPTICNNNTCHTILVMAISIKGQFTSRRASIRASVRGVIVPSEARGSPTRTRRRSTVRVRGWPLQVTTFFHSEIVH